VPRSVCTPTSRPSTSRTPRVCTPLPSMTRRCVDRVDVFASMIPYYTWGSVGAFSK
jgi:hypothetical protein